MKGASSAQRGDTTSAQKGGCHERTSRDAYDANERVKYLEEEINTTQKHKRQICAKGGP